MAAKKLHVNYDFPMNDQWMPWIMTKFMPEFLLKKIVIGFQAPVGKGGRPLDIWETEKRGPYEINEVEKDKVWMVSYVNGVGSPKPMAGFIGADPTGDVVYNKIQDTMKLRGRESEKPRLDRDWQIWKQLLSMDEAEGLSGGYNKLAASNQLFMSVVKLNSGGLLLYSPVIIHEGTPLDTWIRSLGTVEYVIIGSGYHTNHLPETLKRFPDAVYIGSIMAELKLNYLQILPRGALDYNFMDDASLSQINSILEPEGVQIHYNKGDTGCQSAFVIAHNTALEQDMIYGHHDTCACPYCKDGELETEDKYFTWRILRYLMMTSPNSPTDYLMLHRYALMDPCSPMSQMTWPRPNPDGSTCAIFADGLRNICGWTITIK